MRITIEIDESLLRSVEDPSGTHIDADTVRLGLEILVRRAVFDRLRGLRGSEPDAEDVPRRRPAFR